jgi:hypothetical protein
MKVEGLFQHPPCNTGKTLYNFFIFINHPLRLRAQRFPTEIFFLRGLYALKRTRRGAVLRTAPRRGRDLAKRGEAQGGQQGTWTRSALSPT